MNDTDIDSLVPPSREDASRLPWESIDPDDVIASPSPPRASAEQADARSGRPERSVRTAAVADPADEEEQRRHEALADHAFFSDEAVVAAAAANRLEFVGPLTSASDAPTAPVAPDADEPFVPLMLDMSPTADFGTAPGASGADATLPIFRELPESSPIFATTAPAPVAGETRITAADAVAPDAMAPSTAAEISSEAAITFSTTDAILAAASELATLAESLAAPAADDTLAPTIVVPLRSAFEEAAAQTAPQAELQDAVASTTTSVLAATGGGWTIPVMCLGIGLIACCFVIPQGETNRRLRYEQSELSISLDHVQKQVAVNDEFLMKVADDPTLAERLAGRQMKTIRKGQRVVQMTEASSDDGDMSPFALTTVPQPAPLPPYRAKTGTIANLCNNARSRLYLLGAAMAMTAVGLVLGFGEADRAATDPRATA